MANIAKTFRGNRDMWCDDCKGIRSHRIDYLGENGNTVRIRITCLTCNVSQVINLRRKDYYHLMKNDYL